MEYLLQTNSPETTALFIKLKEHLTDAIGGVSLVIEENKEKLLCI
jgi:hypothetical protein